MRIIKSGEIFELQTEKGLAYFQFIFEDKEMGHLIRILDGLFEKRPSNLNALIKTKERFLIYFPLGAALKRKLVVFIQKENLPEYLNTIPPMRRPGGRTKEGKVLNWWIIEEKKEKLVENLTESQQKYSIQYIWNDTLLKERICSNWLPENEI